MKLNYVIIREAFASLKYVLGHIVQHLHNLIHIESKIAGLGGTVIFGK
jgi:hypothetical protein